VVVRILLMGCFAQVPLFLCFFYALDFGLLLSAFWATLGSGFIVTDFAYRELRMRKKDRTSPVGSLSSSRQAQQAAPRDSGLGCEK